MEEIKICSTVKAKLIEEFRKILKQEEELQKSINNSLGKDLSGSQGQLNTFYRSVRFSDTASVCVFRKAVPGNQDMAQFATLRPLVDYLVLIKALTDIFHWTEDVLQKRESRRFLACDAGEDHPKTRCKKFTTSGKQSGSAADLSLLAKKKFDNTSPPVKMDADCS